MKEWWWKAKLGQCYIRLGLYREAEKQLLSSLRDQPMISTYLQLSNVYTRLDLPNTALDVLMKASELYPFEPKIPLYQARVYEGLGEEDKCLLSYKRALFIDPSSVEAVASLAAHYFYADQPEMALRYYRRLVQRGVQSCELWCNLGLCCYHASQWDTALYCMERALHSSTDDDTASDVWYNIGHIAVGIGDLGLAYQAFRVSTAINPNHAESQNNLGVMETRRKQYEAARTCFASSLKLNPTLHEPAYNNALMAHRGGDFSEAFRLAKTARSILPQHHETNELMKNFVNGFANA